MTNNELTLKLDRARWFILQTAPFYGSLAMALTDTIGNPHGKTACVNGKTIFWDTEFLGKLSDAETRYVLLHETLHCAHGHLWRFPAGAVDHKTANCACDHAINLTLNSAKLEISMPAGGLADPQFNSMAEEEIYTALSQKQQPKDGDKPQAGAGSPGDGDGSGDGDGQPSDESAANGKPAAGAGDPCGDYCEPAADETSNGDNGAGSVKQTLRETWQQRVIQAAQAAKASGQGNVPGDMERELDKLAAVKIDWRAETSDFVKNSIASKNDWTRGNKRHLWQSVVYPSRRRDNCGLIIGVRDTSGSIDDKTAAQFSAILGAACAELGAELLLLDCDTDIAAEYRIEAGGDVPLRAAGGGGTDFAAPFIRARELLDAGEHVSGLIYLTDLCGDNFPTEEIVPTLTICTEDRTAPSGRTVRIMD